MAGRIDYEERQEYKKERYQELAEKSREKSQQHYEQYQKMSNAIPLGQPILTDHYSANATRRGYQKMHSQFDKSIEADNKAEYYDNKVEAIENNNSISSDDPKAIEKLQARIEELEKAKVEVKARPHEWYELPYLNADIKRAKDRIKEIQELEELKFEEVIFTGGKAILNREINRLQLLFDTKPNEEIRTLLKGHGFKWSRYEQAWQRLYNRNGIYAVRYVVKLINEKSKEDGII